MLKTKRLNVVLVAIMIVSLVAAYGFAPLVKAASFEDAKDRIGDSNLGATTYHEITIDMGSDLVASEFVAIDFGTDFTGAVEGNVTCPTNSTASTTPSDTVGCVVNGGQSLSSTTDLIITVTGVTSSTTAGDYPVVITTYTTSYVEKENATVLVYIIDDVTVTATVNASLTFGIAGVAQDELVNGATTTIASTAETIPFGTLSSGASTTIAQQLTVSTNAAFGYAVTVEQDGELTSGAGATINSWKNSPDDTGSTTPDEWTAPTGLLNQDWTYGHMGVTGNDSDLFNLGKYVGLNGTSTLTVLSHTGPADGTTQDAGLARVAYTVEITDLQEAGDYTSVLTYICTPTY